MTKIFLHTPDKTACSYYRTILPAMHCYHDLSKDGVQLIFSDQVPKDCDIYVFHRLIKQDLLEFIYELKSVGKSIIHECDDDITSVPRTNPASVLIHERDKKLAKDMLDIWDAIIVTTDHLRSVFNRPEKTFVSPNLVDLCCFKAKKELTRGKFSMPISKPVHVLWAGSNSHDEDLKEIIDPVIEIIEEFGQKVKFTFWGYHPLGLADLVRIPGHDYAYLEPKKKFEKNLNFLSPCEFRSYYDGLITLKPDIALGPLSNHIFNYSKSSIKSLEMIMAGAAFIGTDLPPYQWITKEGILVKPGDKKGWVDNIRELIVNKEKRDTLVKLGQENIKAKYCWQSSARDIWLNMFREITNIKY